MSFVRSKITIDVFLFRECHAYKNITIFVLATLFLGCNEVSEPPQSSQLTRELVEEVSYRHPLFSQMSKDGRVLGLEKKDSESGFRYAIEDSLEGPDEGPGEYSSGIVEYETRVLSNSEHSKLEKQRHITKNWQEGKIHPQLETLLITSSSSSIIPVNIWLNLPEHLSLTNKMDLAIGRGEVVSKASKAKKRKELLQERAILIQKVQSDFLRRIGADGVELTWKFKNLPMLELKLTAEKIQLISQDIDVISIDERTQNKDGFVFGTEFLDGTQLNQFVDHSYDGNNHTPIVNVHWGVIEMGGANYNHPAFRSWSSPSSNRIVETLDCSGSGSSASCSDATWTATATGDHATWVAALVGGDLRDAQDPTVTTTQARIDRSGYAGESHGHIYRANAGGTRYDRVMAAYDHVIANDDVLITNQSNGDLWTSTGNGSDPSCTGRVNLSRTVNSVYESGILPAILAGNEGTGNGGCTIRSAGPALGAFVVGSHGSSAAAANAQTVRTGGIASWTSQGFSGRTIVDLTTFGCRSLIPHFSGGYTSNTATICGTSFSTPALVGSAVDFITFYEDKFSTWIENPGALTANLLLMGDRQGGGGFLNTDFDRRWGAGRLKMRKFDWRGLDNPYGWKTGSVCVDHHQTVKISINGGNTLSTDVDYVKAVIHWYDQRHDGASNSSMDDIDLKLKTTSGTLLRNSNSGADNKERVFYTDPGGSKIELEIYGYSVSADNEGCGANSMRVYYSVLYEDNDRDDGSDLNGIDQEF